MMSTIAPKMIDEMIDVIVAIEIVSILRLALPAVRKSQTQLIAMTPSLNASCAEC